MKKEIRRTFITGLWIICCLLLIDVAVNFLFPYPSNPQVEPKQLSRYFNYGLSVEGKLSQMVRPTDEASSALAVAGWLDPQLWKKLNLATKPAVGEDVLVAIYGMSFAQQVGEAMKEINPKITLRTIAAPAAPPSYAFAAYNLDRGRHEAKVVVLGVLASTTKAMRAMNGMTWQFESPAPYTYPKYFLKDGKLEEIQPQITSLAQLRTTFEDKQKWSEFLTQMRENDQFFNPFLFQHNFLDNFTTVRLIRRAFAQGQQKAIDNQAYSAKNGFNQDYEVPLLKEIVTKFAATAKSDRLLPIVFLINDRGYDDDLFQALKPTLESNSIPYVSTHNIVPASDPANFVGDGHFTKEGNKKIAEAMLKLINQN
ncbi:hypothetical protein [Fortiea contorta]|uniref:hypothetical protein n=1 Tax=Fortiea contorta TaxID=1892405 RepID=UPI00034A1FC4|nr:hypothetical protein [Fortiea contorta]